MERFVYTYEDFVNEELTIYKESGICKMECDWFFYNDEDDIIYGRDYKPVKEDAVFAFNPAACSIILNGEEKEYDINNPICLIEYNTKNKEVKFFITDDVLYRLKELGWKGNSIDVNSESCRMSLMDFFEDNDDNYRHIIIYGTQLVASSFDVIEEE